ncbi:hypothetical protein GVAV_002688 [Gurleya vavrai]
MHNKQKRPKFSIQKLISYPSSCFLGLIFILMDCVSYGRAFFPKAEQISMFMFLFSSLTAQIIYGLATKIQSGIIAGSIVENFKIYEKMYEVSESECRNFEEIMCNTLFCAFLGTLIFSLISFLLMKLNLSRFLRMIPKSAITGCLGAIGISQFEIGLKEIHFSFENFNQNILYFFLITITVSLIAFFLQEYFSCVIFIIPLFTTFVISFFYLIIFIFKISKDHLIIQKWLSEDSSCILKPDLILNNLSFSNLNFSAILKNIPNIISLALFSLIHLPINLPAYSLETNLSCNFNKELKAQSISNFFSAFAFSPTYFVCSNSIFFRRSGGTNKIHSILLGFAIISLFFYGTKLKSLFPCFVLAMFPFFIGINICYSAFYKCLNSCSKIDYFFILLTSAACLITSMEKGILFGTFLNCFYFLKIYYKSFSKKQNYNEIYEKHIKVDYILCFLTLNKFENEIINLDNYKKILIDLRECHYIDWLARDFLIDCDKKKGNFEIIGSPEGFYKENFDNFVCYDNYEEFVKSRI